MGGKYYAMEDCALLVINDNNLLRETAATLRGAGFLVVSLSDTTLAVETLKRITYDVVIADLDTFAPPHASSRVSERLSQLLHYARHTPVVFGSRDTAAGDDLVVFTDTEALVSSVRDALRVKCPLPRDLEEDAYDDIDLIVFPVSR